MTQGDAAAIRRNSEALRRAGNLLPASPRGLEGVTRTSDTEGPLNVAARGFALEVSRALWRSRGLDRASRRFRRGGTPRDENCSTRVNGDDQAGPFQQPSQGLP